MKKEIIEIYTGLFKIFGVMLLMVLCPLSAILFTAILGVVIGGIISFITIFFIIFPLIVLYFDKITEP